jgi:hypothetical protein
LATLAGFDLVSRSFAAGISSLFEDQDYFLDHLSASVREALVVAESLEAAFVQHADRANVILRRARKERPFVHNGKQ